MQDKINYFKRYVWKDLSDSEIQTKITACQVFEQNRRAYVLSVGQGYDEKVGRKKEAQGEQRKQKKIKVSVSTNEIVF